MKNKILISLFLLAYQSFLFSQNSSLNLDGVDDNVEILSTTEFTPNQFTIEVWIKANSSGAQPIFTKYNSNTNEITYALVVNSNNTIRFAVYEADAPNKTRVIDTDNAVLNPNSWQHIAATFDFATQDLKIYVGGTESPATLTPGSITLASIFSGDQPVHIGKITYNSGSSAYFDGRIDDVRFWNTERTQTEISDNMNTELAGTESGLVAYYKMDINNSSCDVEDCNSNMNHGTRIGSGVNNNLPQYSNDIPSLTDADCGVTIACTLLPVELVEFKGTVNKNQIQLNWETESELNNLGF